MTASKANDISTGVALAAVLSEFGGISTVKAGWNIVTPTPNRKRMDWMSHFDTSLLRELRHNTSDPNCLFVCASATNKVDSASDVVCQHLG